MADTKSTRRPALLARWIPVRDESGRIHLQAHWTQESSTPAARRPAA